MPASQVSAPSAATSLDQAEGSAMNALYRAAIGPVNTDYYLPVFERFESAGRAGPGWNRAACLCTLSWMVFRQMWAAALLYAAALGGAALLVLGLGRLVFLFSDNTQLCLLVALGTVAFLAPGVWGNAVLHRQVRKAMERALAATATVPEACVLLNRQASSRQRIIWLTLANAALAGAALGAYIAWPHAPRPAAVTGPVLKPPAAALAARPASAPAKAAPGSAPIPTPTMSAATVTSSSIVGPAKSASAAASSVMAPAPAPVQVAAPESVPARAPVIAESRHTPAPALAPAAATVAAAAHAAAPATPAIKAPTTATSTKHFYINVGLFADDDNARKAHARLLEAGLAAFTEELDTAKGKRTRVRAGPFDTRAAADQAAAKIRDLKLEAVVFQQ
jgi:cell division septation protein DedD